MPDTERPSTHMSVICDVNVNKFPDHCCETLLVRLNSYGRADRQGPDYDMEKQRF